MELFCGCCVPNCSINWGNSPNLKFYTLLSDEKVRKEYKRLTRNTNLTQDASSTRICEAHLPGGERMRRTHLPLVFPWTPKSVKSGVTCFAIIGHEETYSEGQ